jgi:hypothetical protein
MVRRPPKPVLGRGRWQRGARALFGLTEQISTSDLIEWCLWPPDAPRNGHRNRAARHALEWLGACKTERAKTIGRPWLWRLPDGQEYGQIER